MLRIFHIQAPAPQGASDALCATLSAAMDDLMQRHPALRGGSVRASDGQLLLELKCWGSDQWKVSRAARTIGTMLLRRAKLDVTTATMILLETLPDGRSLTLEQGRPASPPRRGGRRSAKRQDQ